MDHPEAQEIETLRRLCRERGERLDGYRTQTTSLEARVAEITAERDALQRRLTVAEGRLQSFHEQPCTTCPHDGVGPHLEVVLTILRHAWSGNTAACAGSVRSLAEKLQVDQRVGGARLLLDCLEVLEGRRPEHPYQAPSGGAQLHPCGEG